MSRQKPRQQNPLRMESLDVDVGSFENNDDMLVMREDLLVLGEKARAGSSTKRGGERPNGLDCDKCYCFVNQTCCTLSCCMTPWFFLKALLAWQLLILCCAILCHNKVPSPFYNISPNYPHLAVAAVYAAVVLLLVSVINRSALKKLFPMGRRDKVMYAKKGCLIVALYFLCGVVVHYVAKALVYPGTVFKLPSEEYYNHANDFNFDSHGATLIGSTLTYFSGAESQVEKTYPFIFYGGNGGTGSSNCEVAEDFVYSNLMSIDADPTVAYKFYSFSYRGYYPNDKYTISEKAMVQDADAFFRYVQLLHPDVSRLPLFGHSLGTGPATSASLHFSAGDGDEDDDDKVACTLLAMPYSNIAQVTLEVGYSTSLAYLWWIDKWDSLARIGGVKETVPLVVLSAGKDALIAPYHQVLMFDKSKAKDKIIMFSEDTIHDDLYSPIKIFEDEYKAFFDKCLRRADGSEE